MNWKTSDGYGLCILIFLKKIACVVGVIEKPHNDECLVYIFIFNFENGTPIIFNKQNY